MNHPIIDSDTHVNEPPDLWTSRLAAKFRDRAPHLVDGSWGGKAWTSDDGRTMAVNMLINTAGGLTAMNQTTNVAIAIEMTTGTKTALMRSASR